MKQNNIQLISANQEKIDKSNKDIATYNLQIADIETRIEALYKLVEDFDQQQNKQRTLEKYEDDINKNLKKVEKEIEFYRQNTDCPVCKQTIDEDHRECEIKEKRKKKTELDDAVTKIDEELQLSIKLIQEMTETQKSITDFQSEITKHNASISAINQYIQKVNEEIQSLNEKGADVTDASKKLKKLKTDQKNLLSLKEQYSNMSSIYDVASVLLKDGGIKTTIIKKYLPIMNKLINKYLASMDFYVSFNLDENFNETIKSRFRDEFTYASFSEGEKMRIDLALLFTWRAIAKLKNSMSTNLLVLDEVFDSSLDEDGTSDFLKILHSLGNESNVFIISHKGEVLYDKFKSMIKFEKHKNFSRIV